MYGLDYSHGRMHIVRAAMEGVMYRLYSVYEAISGINKNAAQIRATGGYIKSDVWLQMQADIFNKEILVCPVSETSALGAAYLAMAAVGAISGIRDILPSMKPKKVVTPIAENHEVYIRSYKKAMEVYGNVYYRQRTL
jgi:gluconokinase